MLAMKFKHRIVAAWVFGIMCFTLLCIYVQTATEHKRLIQSYTDDELISQLSNMPQEHLNILRRKLVKSGYNSSIVGDKKSADIRINPLTIDESKQPDVEENRIEEPENLETTESPSALREPTTKPVIMHYKFPKHLAPHIIKHPSYPSYSADLRELDKEDDRQMAAFRAEIRRRGRKLNLYSTPPEPDMTSWELFHNHISQYELYREDGVVDAVLRDMATQPITAVEWLTSGTQLKLIFTLKNDMEVLFKPKRLASHVTDDPNLLYYSVYERHNSEIAAFHLDRLMGFRRTPPCVGRAINVTRDVYQLGNSALRKTFYISPVNNICFFAKCDYFCDSRHPVCGNPQNLEGSFALLLPPEERVDRKSMEHPYIRTYSRHSVETWKTDQKYCDNVVRKTPPYDSGRKLLDVMDIVIFDFLLGNMDRHHYEIWKLDVFNTNNTSPIHLDHGRGFGKFSPEYSILLALDQCCVIRYSTLRTLRNFHRGPKRLSDQMRESLRKDTLKDILPEAHLKALDERVVLILKSVHRCLERVGDFNKVVIDDLM